VALGLTVKTNAGGTGKWRPEFAEAFKGCNGVVVLPDNDEPGRKHVQDVARSLHAAGVSVKVVDLPGLPAKGDVSDWLGAGGTKAALVALAIAAPRWEPAHDTGDAAQPPEDEREAALLALAVEALTPPELGARLDALREELGDLPTAADVSAPPDADRASCEAVAAFHRGWAHIEAEPSPAA